MNYDDAIDLKAEILDVLPSMSNRRDGELPPPVGIGLAPSTVAGQFRIAVRPRYKDDLTPTALAFLRHASGGELDLRYTGPIEPTGCVVTVGAAAAHRQGRTGTIGFFARRNSDSVLGFVSANHVIAASDRGVDGDEILYLPQADARRNAADCIALLAGDYPRLSAPGLRTADCAFARLVDGIDVEPSYIGEGEALAAEHVLPERNLQVSKIGCSTGRTFGRITAEKLDDFAVNYSCGEARFRDQIEIESWSDVPFSGRGDSGAVAFTADRHPLGLIYARSAAGGNLNCGLTYATPIAAVLEALNVTLVA